MELKTDDAEYVINHLRKNGFADNEVVMSSAKLSHLADSRSCSSDMFLHWIFADENRLTDLYELGNAGYSLEISDPFTCDEKKIEIAHRMGLKICLRAADSVMALERMKKLGLDYFPTNKMHDRY